MVLSLRFSFVLLPLLLALGACIVPEMDLSGLACDQAHPCTAGLVCVEGICVEGNLPQDAAVNFDASAPAKPDASEPVPEDAGNLGDAALPDAELPAPDAGSGDGSVPDAAASSDAGAADGSASDAGPAPLDAGMVDAGSVDAGNEDAGAPDTGGFDGGLLPDAGAGDAGPSATCSDGVLNGAETDVDCGGADCGDCDPGKTCTADADCASGWCRPATGVCVIPTCGDGEQNGPETDVDCGGTCAGCGATKGCLVDADCAAALWCHLGTFACAAPTCSDGYANADETDVDCGGPDCSDCGLGKACAQDSDCASGWCPAASHQCVSPLCTDGFENGTETDVDCGGSCPACGQGEGCEVDLDCAAPLWCPAGSQLCTAPTCDDGRLNGDETDLDCGGPDCPDCGLGKDCVADSDCASGWCRPATDVCVTPTCGDGERNGTETDVDCGGSCAGCALAKSCSANGDCASGACVGGSCIEWWNPAWSHKREITVDNGANSTTLSGYPVTVTLDTQAFVVNGKMLASGDDLRFVDADEATVLPHWIESGMNTASTKIWVRVATLPGLGSRKIWLYHGNAGAPSGSGYAATFAEVFGNGADGNLNVTSGTFTLSAQTNGHGGRTAADAVRFQTSGTISAGAISVTLTSATTGLAVGDEVAIVNLQGTASEWSAVGNMEIRRIAALTSDSVTFDFPLLNAFGNSATQKIVLQRVPRYQDVTVAAGATLTADAWDGTKGGLLLFRANGTVTINGTVTMTAKGYAGGAGGGSLGYYAYQQGDNSGGAGSGPSGASGGAIGGGGAGMTIVGASCNGGSNAGAGGGGGGHAAAGSSGGATVCATTAGAGGASRGASVLDLLFMGAGGGGGSGASAVMCGGGTAGSGAAGGGIVYLFAAQATVGASGAVTNDGGLGASGVYGCSTQDCYGGSGGSGAGGSTRIVAASLTLSGTVTATGGSGVSGNYQAGSCGETSGSGGAGAAGRIRLDTATLTGTSNPAAYTAALENPARDRKISSPEPTASASAVVIAK